MSAATPKGFVLRTPLHRWSQANGESAEFLRLAGELHTEVGKAYGGAIAGTEPTATTCKNLCAKARRLLKLIENPAAMHEEEEAPLPAAAGGGAP